MTHRSSFLTAAAVVLGLASGAASPRAETNPTRLTYLTFSGPVGLPGVTLAAASTVSKAVAKDVAANVKGAKTIGELAAKKALDKGIKEVVFDRGGMRYHGKVKALADAAREAGLKF